jgi:hypothetical protein
MRQGRKLPQHRRCIPQRPADLPFLAQEMILDFSVHFNLDGFV